MQPTPSQVWVDQLLTNVSVAYSNSDYIADKIFPFLPVTNRSGIVPMLNQSAFFRNEAKLRAPATKSEATGYGVSNTNFVCERYSIRHEIPDEVRDNAASVYDQDRIATNFVTEMMMLNRELALATNFFAASKWTGGTAGGDNTVGSQWSNYSASSPLSEIEAWRDTIQGSLGRDPNTLVTGREVWSQLKYHPDVIDLIKYTQAVRSPIAPALFASLIEVDNVYIGNAIYTSTLEGTAESAVVYQRVWGKNALLLYVPPGASLDTPAAGYTIVWQRVPNALQYIKRMRNEELEIDIVEGNSYYVHKLLVAKAGAFAASVVA